MLSPRAVSHGLLQSSTVPTRVSMSTPLLRAYGLSGCTYVLYLMLYIRRVYRNVIRLHLLNRSVVDLLQVHYASMLITMT